MYIDKGCTQLVQGPELHFQHWKIEKGEEEQRSGVEWRGVEEEDTQKSDKDTLSYGKARVNMGDKLALFFSR